jgi:hypothetical protein
MTIASLAMYPYDHLRPAYNQFWDAVRARLSSDAPELDWSLDPLDACRRDDLLLGQTCGWPLVTELAPSVRVVGTFDCDVEGAHDGTYCSVNVLAPMAIGRNFKPGFRIRLHQKDLRNALLAGESMQVPLPLTSMVQQMLITLMNEGKGDLDHQRRPARRGRLPAPPGGRE